MPSGGYAGGLIGWNFGLVSDWGEDYFKISDVFIYGDITIKDQKGYIIGCENHGDYHEFTAYFNFANTYYLDGIGAQMFVASNPNGSGGFGTKTVQEVIKSKTAGEFASAGMAELLNNGRTVISSRAGFAPPAS
jgi:hypothetical protein